MTELEMKLRMMGQMKIRNAMMDILENYIKVEWGSLEKGLPDTESQKQAFHAWYRKREGMVSSIRRLSGKAIPNGEEDGQPIREGKCLFTPAVWSTLGITESFFRECARALGFENYDLPKLTGLDVSAAITRGDREALVKQIASLPHTKQKFAEQLADLALEHRPLALGFCGLKD